MNKPNVNPLTRTDDAGLNLARQLAPDADPVTVGLMAALMNRGLLSSAELLDYISRAKAISR